MSTRKCRIKLTPNQDVTARVERAENYAFRNEEFADLWKGRWRDGSSHGSVIQHEFKAAVLVLCRSTGLHQGHKSSGTGRLAQGGYKEGTYSHFHHVNIPETFFKRVDDVLLVWAELQCLNHSHIVPFYGVHNEISSLPSPVTKFYANGDALAYIARNPSSNKLRLVSCYVFLLKVLTRQQVSDIASALDFLHSRPNPIVHGNLKAVSEIALRVVIHI